MMNFSGPAGEYRVASELCRRDLIATTFTRNMPGFDILVVSEKSITQAKIQVKTILNGDWSLNSKRYINFDEKAFENGKQIVTGINNNKECDFIVFVKLGRVVEEDKFYILSDEEIKNIVRKDYSSFLERINHTRPKNPQTTHIGIKKESLTQFNNKWEKITDYFKPTQGK